MPEFTHLPADVVAALDTLSAGTDDPTPALETLSQRRVAELAWLARHAEYTMHDMEAAVFQEIHTTWTAVEQAPGRTPAKMLPARLLFLVTQAFKLGARVRIERSKPHFSPRLAVNDLLMAGAALALGRTAPPAVTSRCPAAQTEMADLRQTFTDCADCLLPEARAEIDGAFTHLDAALAEVASAAEAGDVRRVAEALARVQSADAILQHFVDWERQSREALEARYRRYALPGAGPWLEQTVEQALQMPRAQWGPWIHAAQESVLPRLRAAWTERVASALLPADRRESCLGAADARLDDVDAAVAALQDSADSDTQVLAALDLALQRLADAFAAVESASWRPDMLYSRRAEQYLDLLVGLQRRTIPVLALLEMLRDEPPAEGWMPLFTHLAARPYALTPAVIGEAAALLVRIGSLREQPDDDIWACPYCGYGNFVQDADCGRCRLRTETPKWSALGRR